MAHTTKCPACGGTLRVPDDVDEPVLTCPRCLADVPNPGWQSTAQPPSQPTAAAPPAAAEATSAAITEAPAQTWKTCPGCGRRLESGWQFCPYCDYRRSGRDRVRRGLAPDREVRQDTRGVGCGLVGLAVLGALGLGIYFLPSMAYVAQTGEIMPFIPLVLVLLLLGGIATGVMFARTRHNPEARGIGRVIFGTLVGAGILCLVALAAGIVFFVVCLANFRFH